MLKIQKAFETMSAKTRVQRFFQHEKTDRVPIDYLTNPTIHRRLLEAFDFAPDANDSTDRLLEILGVDFRKIQAPYHGPLLFQERPGLKVDPEYGYYSRWVDNPYGGYEDYCVFPLKDVDSEIIAGFPVPNPDDYDYTVVPDQVKKYQGYALYVGDPGYGDIINSLGRVMGMEDALVNLYLGDEATLAYVERKIKFELGKLERLIIEIKKAGNSPDFLWMGEDLGTQIAPMISHDLFLRVFRPAMQQFVSLANAYSLPVMIHTCGSSEWAYEDFIAMGVKAVDTLQPEAAHMAPEELKSKFGGRLAFHGCISTAAIAKLDEAGVETLCRNTLEILMPTHAYAFSPTHQIQDNTPIQNVIRMYQTAHTYGVYK
ncbi:MAG: uroporphyrinogen decarboxylase family protein [Candidatus Izemoplasmatales bacterium]|nr:uroporphyrinogen decarboxylase family protein [Candidatus Izemoplasmatales bacterium]